MPLRDAVFAGVKPLRQDGIDIVEAWLLRLLLDSSPD